MEMKMKEFYFKTDDLVIWRPHNSIDLEKIQTFVNFLDQQNPVRSSQFMRFIDLTHTKKISVNSDDLYSIASLRRKYAARALREKVKVAFFVNNSFTFGMARMYENILDSTSYDIHIYYSLEEIAEFLDVDISLLKS